LAGRFELLHLPFSATRRLVRILRSVVQSLVLAMLNVGHDLSLRRTVAGKLVGNHDTGRPHLPLQQLAQQTLSGLFVASALDQNVEHDTGLIHGSPKPMLYPSNFEHDLIQMPLIADLGKAATDLVGERLTELARPLSDGLVADDNVAGRQQLLNHPQPERETEI